MDNNSVSGMFVGRVLPVALNEVLLHVGLYHQKYQYATA